MGWLIGLEPATFWGTHEGEARSEPERSDGNLPKAQEVRGTVRGNASTGLRNAERSDDFLLKVPLSEQKNRRYAYAHLRNSQRWGG